MIKWALITSIVVFLQVGCSSDSNLSIKDIPGTSEFSAEYKENFVATVKSDKKFDDISIKKISHYELIERIEKDVSSKLINPYEVSDQYTMYEYSNDGFVSEHHSKNIYVKGPDSYNVSAAKVISSTDSIFDKNFVVFSSKTEDTTLGLRFSKNFTQLMKTTDNNIDFYSVNEDTFIYTLKEGEYTYTVIYSLSQTNVSISFAVMHLNQRTKTYQKERYKVLVNREDESFWTNESYRASIVTKKSDEDRYVRLSLSQDDKAYNLSWDDIISENYDIKNLIILKDEAYKDYKSNFPD